ncbi:MAG TPA: glycerol-3-phosphate 1-O-acyltransferase PlsY [Casimicrobiaceae bacterium]|nr:glycerol-3-phosphate 1-O-acyltransferase PlsY [Casimicrobiaceae bacterium]
MPAVLIVIAAYLLGSVSFAVVVSKAFALPDPHDYGSGNPGATNVLRTGNKLAAVLTLAGDGFKGWLAVFVAAQIGPSVGASDWVVPASALAVFLGHLYPVFHKFAGGKGVSTAAGIVYALHWPLGLTLMVVWITMAFGFRISSLAALTAATLMPLGGFYFFGNSLTAWSLVAIAALLFWRHRANINKLLGGRERPIGR